MSKEYLKEALTTALDAVKNGMTVHTASKTFKVPKTTLYNHFKKNLNADIKQGAPSILSKQQEDHLVTWIEHMAEIGFPISKNILLDSVSLLAKDLNISHKFRNGRPGRHWYEGFLKRNPSVSKRVAQYLVKSRAQVTEAKLREWFTEVRTYIEMNSYLNIFNHPERIFNCDETAFFLSPKENAVLVPKGQKSVYSFAANDEKENITTLIMGNALGKLGPPMVVLPYKRIPAAVAKSMPANWGIGRSDSGWMTGELFYEYIANIFHPWLISQKIKFPIVLFVDGHTSHMTLNLSKFCNENKIILIALLPNSTSILQPMDVAYFHPLKQSWREEVKKWRMEKNGARMRREDFAPLLSSILYTESFEKNLENGFKACGLCPFNANAINYEKLLIKKSRTIEFENRSVDKKSQQICDHLQEYVGIVKLKQFEDSFSSNSWNGAIEDSSLFEYWKNLQKETLLVDKIANLSCSNISTTNLTNFGSNMEHEIDDLNNALNIDSMEIDLNVLLGNNSELLLNVEADGSVNITNEYETPIKSSDSQINYNLPTPFKKNLMWPSPVETISTKRKKLPAVVSSEQWLLYTKSKLDKKEQEEKEKTERKRQRLEKKRNIPGQSKVVGKPEEVKRKKPADNHEFKIQCYVIVKYEDELFPGIIEKIKKDEYFVKVMCMSGTNWKWPEKDDVCWYNKSDIIQTITEPILINARGVYAVAEIKLLRDKN